MIQNKQEPIGEVADTFTGVANGKNRFHRILSMLLDHFIMSVLIVPPGIIYTVLLEHLEMKLDDEIEVFGFFVLIFMYLNKDFFRGKSPAKRILGYQVIDRKTKTPATELQCFIRNLTIGIAWPLEAIIGFINPERRIGDVIANTKVVASDKEELKSLWTDFKNTRFKINSIGILIIGVIYFYGISRIFF